MARLDRLGSAKEVAQIGAAIGRDFSHSLLAAVMRKPEVELGLALERLKPVCCSDTVCRRMRHILSSMLLCRMRLTARY